MLVEFSNEISALHIVCLPFKQNECLKTKNTARRHPMQTHWWQDLQLSMLAVVGEAKSSYRVHVGDDTETPTNV